MLKKLYKKLFGVLILAAVLLTMFPNTKTYASSTDASSPDFSISDLSNKSGDECVEILEQYGLELSDAYSDSELAATSVKVIIDDLNSGKLAPGAIPYNYTELANLAKQVMLIASENDSTFATKYTLIDSTVIGSWSDSYGYYNCYGYAIGNHIFVDPGHYSNKSFSISLPISSIADLVIADLDSLGYYSYKTATKPSSLLSWEKVICIRKGSTDYHFMRGISINNWAHKPGGTNPLSWKYTSPEAKIWTNEHSYYNNSYAGDTTYNSTTYYIRYWEKNGPGPQPTELKDIY